MGSFLFKQAVGNSTYLVIVQWQSLCLPFFPVDVFGCHTMFFHCDAAIHRANQLAKVASYTFFIFHCIGIVWFALCNIDSLMRCVFTCDITQTTVNTFILVDLCNMMIIDIKVFPMG